MVLVRGGEFDLGGNSSRARADQFPVHRVRVGRFFMDKTEVTNAQFKKFVDATGHITTAEKNPDWEELKSSCRRLPRGLFRNSSLAPWSSLPPAGRFC